MSDEIKALVEQLEAWAPLVSSGYEVPAAGQAMMNASRTLTAQADEIERLRAALNATADEQDERSAAWERAIAAGLKRMTVSKDYARGAHNESQVAAIKIRAALKAAQEVKS